MVNALMFLVNIGNIGYNALRYRDKTHLTSETQMTGDKHTNWRRALGGAVPIILFVLSLFYYWYAVADRYAIFLYGHTTTGIPRAQPFDEMTSSRYWMAGLVASGAVMVLYTAANWLLGRIAAWHKQNFLPPAWEQVWLLSAIPLVIGIFFITMTFNSPTLPPRLAAACVAATLLGLALALLPGRWAAQCPLDLVWLGGDGLGLMPALLLLRVIELPGRGLSVSVAMAWLLAVGGILAGVVWLVGLTFLRVWRHRPTPSAPALFLAGLGLSYLLMPLIHHLMATPPAFRYISTSSNFFAFNLNLQLFVLVVAASLAVGVTQARKWLDNRS